MDLCIKYSEINGYGIFTNIDIPTDQKIANLLENSKVVKIPSKYSIQIGPNLHIEQKGLVALLNHSCKPNCKITQEYNLVSICPIKVGEELTYNYLTTEYDLEEKFSCLCQEENCIRRIAGYKYYEKNDINLIWT